MTRYEITIDTKHRPDVGEILSFLLYWCKKKKLEITYKEKR